MSLRKHSCNYCQSLATLNPLFQTTEDELRRYLGARPRDPGNPVEIDLSCLFPFLSSINAWNETSDSRCLLAAELLRLAAACDELKGKPFVLAAKFVTFPGGIKGLCFGAIYEFRRGPLLQSCLSFNAFDAGRYCLITTSAKPLVRKVATLDVNYTTASALTSGLARGWLERCSKHHPTCMQPASQFPPKRLIELARSSDQKVLRLVPTAGRSDLMYAALSYCWGGEQTLKTTQRNLTQRLISMSSNELPQTLKDALAATESLGLQYLWIDSLCIVQDDDQDKAQEIARMHGIYASATVTIAASRSLSVADGFLHDRPPIWTQGQQLNFELPVRLPGGKPENVLLVPLLLPSLRQPPDPLDSRAWTYQERLLSPRVIDFGSLSTRWVCKESVKSESHDFIDGWVITPTRNTVRDDTFQDFIKALDNPTTSDLPTWTKSLVREWETIVQQFTARSISFPTDRLLAMGGIAHAFQAIVKDEYCAGLWRSILGESLLWKIPFESGVSQRPPEYIAPSWSWASTNRRVWIGTGSALDLGFQVLDCQVKPIVQDSPFANVKGGYLKVKGCHVEASWTRVAGQGSPEDRLRFQASRTSHGNPPFCPDFWSDALPHEFMQDSGSTLHISLLLVSAQKGDFGTSQIRGIGLRLMGTALYSRVGYFELRLKYSKFDECLDCFRESGVDEFTII